MKKMNKKAQGEYTLTPLILLIIGIVVFTMIAIAFIYYDLPGKFRDMIPGFEKGDEEEKIIGTEQSQPAELRGADECIGMDFYWSYADGELITEPVVDKEIFIAISFLDTTGDLLDSSNICTQYGFLVRQKIGENEYEEHIDKGDSFQKVFKKGKKISKGGRTYYLYPSNIELRGRIERFFKFDRVYDFIIDNFNNDLVRRGEEIIVK